GAAVTVAGAAATFTVAFLLWFSGSMIAKLPVFVNWNVTPPPGASTGDVKAHVLQTTWWFAVSLFVQDTESPAVIETVPGTNPAFEMSIATVLLDVAGAGAATRRAAAPATSMSFFITVPLPWGYSPTEVNPHGVACAVDVPRAGLAGGEVRAVPAIVSDMRRI